MRLSGRKGDVIARVSFRVSPRRKRKDRRVGYRRRIGIVVEKVWSVGDDDGIG